MAWLKITLERLFGLLAPVIPGAAVLIVLGIHHQRWAATIRNLTYLTYSTKVVLVVAAALVSGWTVSTAYFGLMGALEGALAPFLQKWLSSENPSFPPWRDKTWRALMKKYLGDAAPEDVDLIADETFNLQIERAKLIQDPRQQFEEVQRLNREKANAVIMDLHWQTWWSNMHHAILADTDPVTKMSLAIEANLQAASLVLLFSIHRTPVLYHWWVVLPCVFWIVMRVVRAYAFLYNLRNPWASSQKQMAFLRSQLPTARARAVGVTEDISD